MGKAAQRRRQAHTAGVDDIHARIASESARNRNGSPGYADSGELPELTALLRTASEHINAAMPAQFQYEGRTYWLRCSIGMARIEVFDGPAKGSPIVAALCSGGAGHGHTPRH